MNCHLLVNPKSGNGRQPDVLERLLKSARQIPDLQVHVLQPGQDARKLAQERVASGARRIAVAGGDGTIGSVANALVSTDVALIPITFGTKNHFCTDMGVTSNPMEGLQAIFPEKAATKEIDVGCVNGLYFLDNSSLGLYPYLVKRRLKRHDRMGKWPAYLIAAIELLRHPIQLRVQVPMEEKNRPTPVGLIFVSNNIMDAAWPTPGRRERMDGGLLQVFVLKEGNPLFVFRAAAAFLRGKTADSPVLNEHRVEEFSVEVHQRRREPTRISIDGEIHTALPPIKYSVVPRGLRVDYVPASATGEGFA